MNYKIITFCLLLIMTSCRINVYRPIETNVVDLDKTEKKFILSMTSVSDTFITLRKSDCHLNSDNYLIVIYKENGLTKSSAYSSYGNYPKVAILDSFNWSLILNSIDSINIQQPKPSYYGSIIEGDTTWHIKGEISGEQLWVFNVKTKLEITSWETVSTERNANPSMAKTKITNYILTETYNKIWRMNELYGERKYKKKPIIGKRWE